MTTLPTQNEAWGFFGTISHKTDPAPAWDAAFLALTKATGAAPEGVRDFLDSRHGRHFADTVTDGLATNQPLAKAIDSAITQWTAWRIGAETSREYGIPKGMPYLTGWVWHFDIMDENV